MLLNFLRIRPNPLFKDLYTLGEFYDSKCRESFCSLNSRVVCTYVYLSPETLLKKFGNYVDDVNICNGITISASNIEKEKGSTLLPIAEPFFLVILYAFACICIRGNTRFRFSLTRKLSVVYFSIPRNLYTPKWSLRKPKLLSERGNIHLEEKEMTKMAL